eukprot:TRINITY_DN12655_c0_g2_i1.p1 TRINITY_DN12655_c0_g2~~TRINITY_DN12655_c0_g2_i1.p1  ORF type:complete len:614 (-),score=111.47 TRINITY_DN12655_c0_g2_i1:85-1926(-)
MSGCARSWCWCAFTSGPKEGEELKAVAVNKSCPKCLKHDVSGSNFCPLCGTPVWIIWDSQPSPVPLRVHSNAPPPRTRAAPKSCEVCIGCGTACANKDSFCRGCGRRSPALVSVGSGGDIGSTVEEPAPLVLHGKSTREQLQELLAARPYLDTKDHYLWYYVQTCREKLYAASGNPTSDADDGGDDDDGTVSAQYALDNLVAKLRAEESMILAAFRMFDADRSGTLGIENVRHMLEYLGSSHAEKDVENFLIHVDTSRDGLVSVDEFMNYVGDQGGIEKVLACRRRQIATKRGSTMEHLQGQDTDLKYLSEQLMLAGIAPQAQASWQLVSSHDEMSSVDKLEPCQQAALRHIRGVAQENHNRAFPALHQRVTKLGFNAEDLSMVLSWIRDLAPIVFHVNLDKVGQALASDTHYRNQFETNTSSGLLRHDVREKWERALFGSSYDSAEPFDRPKYGVQNVWNDPRGVMGCKQYGDSYIELRNVRLRCTCSAQDTSNLTVQRLAVLDYYAHVLLEYSDQELSAVFDVARENAENVGDSDELVSSWGKYKEVQIHGPVSLDDDVARLVVNERHRGKPVVEKIRKARPWPVVYMNDLRGVLLERQDGSQTCLPGREV